MKTAAYHYYGTANSTYNQYLLGETIRYKIYLYALRPLLAGRYIELYQCPPPVVFAELLKMEMPDELKCGIEKLLELKKIMDEKTENMPIPVIQEFIHRQLMRQKKIVEKMGDDRKSGWEELNKVFLEVLLEEVKQY